MGCYLRYLLSDNYETTNNIQRKVNIDTKTKIIEEKKIQC